MGGLPLGEGLASDPERPTVSDCAQAPTADQLVDMPWREAEVSCCVLDGHELRGGLGCDLQRNLICSQRREPELSLHARELGEDERDLSRAE